MPNMTVDWPQSKTAFPLLGGIILAVLTGIVDVFSWHVLTGLVREQAQVKETVSRHSSGSPIRDKNALKSIAN